MAAGRTWGKVSLARAKSAAATEWSATACDTLVVDNVARHMVLVKGGTEKVGIERRTEFMRLSTGKVVGDDRFKVRDVKIERDKKTVVRWSVYADHAAGVFMRVENGVIAEVWRLVYGRIEKVKNWYVMGRKDRGVVSVDWQAKR